MQWLEGDFLSYLKSWEDSFSQRPNFNKGEQNKMLLSEATLNGIRMTGTLMQYNMCIHVHNSKTVLSPTFLLPIIVRIFHLILPPDLFISHILFPVHSFVELTTILLAVPGVQYILLEKFCQDPVESFFGKQRAQGGRNENPNAKQFMDNTVSLRVQGSMALDPNCRKRNLMDHNTCIVDETPLPKQKRVTCTMSYSSKQ